ncbi:MAG: 23S rRNA pseudouridine(1911/1915/1917) synthase RluD [Acidiferrobacterales bacterium]|nr:23S rRNA pseudouridine(1911/1915/1917) synthase RluD [Acidiferrobacterales bacterium]
MPYAPGLLTLDVPIDYEGMRIDKTLAELLPEYSRAHIQKWLKSGRVTSQGKNVKASEKIRGSTSLSLEIPPVEEADWVAQEAKFDVMYQDHDILVIDKPAGLVVHPGAGNPDHTLLNGLLFIDDNLRTLPRAGIVHRLDKLTSGLMVVARTEQARQHLVEQLKERTVSRRYLAVVNGVPVTGETIDQPIGRHPQDRLKMAVTHRGKEAITHTRIEQKFRTHALIEAALETGRTHQIRVHLSWRGYPLVGDAVYGSRVKLPPAASEGLVRSLQEFSRQALHAKRLEFIHPKSEQIVSWETDLPMDMRQLLTNLAADHQSHSGTSR